MSEAGKDFSTGIGTLGSIFGVVLSWSKWHSFWWALLHGCLGWFYVIWYFLFKHY